MKGMPLEEKTWAEVTTPDRNGHCLIGDDNEKFRRDVLDRLENVERWPTVQGIVYFLNEDFNSSQFGHAGVLPYGPDCTITDIEAIKQDPLRFYLHDLPSERQYPQWYISRERHLAARQTPPATTG